MNTGTQNNYPVTVSGDVPDFVLFEINLLINFDVKIFFGKQFFYNYIL